MKLLFLGFTYLLLPRLMSAQNPVTWTFNTNKVADKTYEIHLTATIQNSWHLYSQNQPAEAIAIPTSIIFGKNPLTKLVGKVKEVGKLEKHKEPKLDIEQWQYSNKVDFVQTITLKANAKTKINGNIEYQTCTDGKCLPPTMVKFSLKLE